MKTVLIIYPHWVPANLAGVQRPRLIVNYLKKDYIVLTLTFKQKMNLLHKKKRGVILEQSIDAIKSTI